MRTPNCIASPAPVAFLSELGSAILVGALAIAVFFFHLGTYGLWEPDEARYAEIAREMLVLRDFVVPHLNYVPYIEKPPLLFWLTALAMHWLGVNELAARLMNAIAALVGVGAVYIFSRRVFGLRQAVWSAVMLITTTLYALMAQVLTTDMLLTATLTIALFTFFLHWHEGGRWCWLMYLAIGLAVLTKGPIGLALPFAIGAIFLIVERDWRGAVRRFRLLPGLVVSLVVAGPWFVAVAIRQPDFLDFYLIGEHFRRFFQSSYSHGQPFYYYIPVLLAGTLPWSLLALFVRWGSLAPDAARRFCLIGATTIFVVFSLASAKLIPYILPAIPLLAVALASGLFGESSNAAQAGLSCRRFAACGPLLGLAGAGALLVAIFANRFASPNAATVRPALYAGAAIFLLAGGLCFAAFWEMRFTLGMATIAAAMCAVLIVASYGRIMAEPLRSYAQLGRTIAARAPAARLICYPRYIQSLPFYAHRRVILVGPQTELTYGAAHAPDAAQYFFRSRVDLMRLWSSQTPTVVIMDKGAFPPLAARLTPYTVVAEDPKKIAVEPLGSATAEGPGNRG